MDMSKCNHRNVQELRTVDSVLSTCPDCGFRELTPIKEVDRITNEILDDLKSKNLGSSPSGD